TCGTRLSRIRTRCPYASSSSATKEPMNPAPPVIKTLCSKVWATCNVWLALQHSLAGLTKTPNEACRPLGLQRIDFVEHACTVYSTFDRGIECASGRLQPLCPCDDGT